MGLSVITLRKEPDMGSTSLSFSLKKGILAFIRDTLPLLSELWLTYPLGCVTIVSSLPGAVCIVSLPGQVMYKLLYVLAHWPDSVIAACRCNQFMIPSATYKNGYTAPTIAVQIRTVIAQGW